MALRLLNCLIAVQFIFLAFISYLRNQINSNLNLHNKICIYLLFDFLIYFLFITIDQTKNDLLTYKFCQNFQIYQNRIEIFNLSNI